MTLWIAIWLALWSPPTARQVVGLRSTAPDYLSLEQVHDNLVAARAAGIAQRVRPELLLSIAWHESRYHSDEITAEPGGLVSCGVMTPVPHARPCAAAELDLLGGYDSGAAHLRVWLDVCRDDERCALLGYAGGYALIRNCRERSDGLCSIVDVFQRRAAWILRATKREIAQD